MIFVLLNIDVFAVKEISVLYNSDFFCCTIVLFVLYNSDICAVI